MSIPAEIRQNRILIYIHFAMTLALPFLLLWMMGCIEKAEETEADYGSQVSEESIELAISKAVHGNNPDAFDVGNLVETVDLRRLENVENVDVLGRARVFVKSKELIDADDTHELYRFLLDIATSVRISDDDFEVRYSQQTIESVRAKADAPIEPTMHSVSLPRLSAAAQAMVNSKVAQVMPTAKIKRVSYHKLKQFTELVDVPARVKARSDCGGISSCKMSVRYMQYDQVNWYESGDPFKIHYDYGFSVETPFIPYGQYEEKLAGLAVNLCVSYYVPVENRTVYVRDCKILDDFQK